MPFAHCFLVLFTQPKYKRYNLSYMDNNSGVYYGGVASQAKKPFITKKKIIKVAVIAGSIIVVGVLLWFFVFRQLLMTSQSDAKKIIEDFSQEYKGVLTEYETVIGFGGMSPLSEAVMSDATLVVDVGSLQKLESMVSGMSDVRVKLDATSSEIRYASNEINSLFASSREESLTTLTKIENNVELLKRMNSALDSMSVNIENCGDGDEIMALINDENVDIAKIAGSYSSAVCAHNFSEAGVMKIQSKQRLVSAKIQLVRMMQHINAEDVGLDGLGFIGEYLR